MNFFIFSRHYIFIILFFILVINQSAYPNEETGKKSVSKKRVAVLKFATNNTPENFSRIVRNLMEVSLYASGEFQLLEWEHIQKVLANHQWQNRKNIDINDSVRLGKALGTDFLVVGSIDKIADYRITTRVVSVKDKRILMAYSQKFSDATEVDSIVEKMAQKVSQDIRRYVQTGIVDRQFYDTFKIKVGAEFNYIQPIGGFKDLVNGGFGFTFTTTVENIFFDNFFLGIGVGYYSFTGAANSSDSLRIIPLHFDVGYVFQVHRRLSLAPVLSPGFSFLTLKHGLGLGFNMLENSEKSYTEPSLMLGFNIDLHPSQHFNIVFSTKYGFIYETKGMNHFILFSLGVLYVF